MQENTTISQMVEQLRANIFYERLGLQKVSSESGKLRTLNVWKYTLST